MDITPELIHNLIEIVDGGHVYVVAAQYNRARTIADQLRREKGPDYLDRVTILPATDIYQRLQGIDPKHILIDDSVFKYGRMMYNDWKLLTQIMEAFDE